MIFDPTLVPPQVFLLSYFLLGLSVAVAVRLTK